MVALLVFSNIALAAEDNASRVDQARRVVESVENAEDPASAYEALSREDHELLHDYVEVATIETEQVRIAPTTRGSQRCGVNSYTVHGKNILGLRLWGFNTRTSWCWDGEVITNTPHFTIRGYTNHPLWRYNGVISERETGGQGQWTHQDYAQGSFSYCLGGRVGCVQSQYPYVDKTQYGNGKKRASGRY